MRSFRDSHSNSSLAVFLCVFLLLRGKIPTDLFTGSSLNMRPLITGIPSLELKA